MAARHHHQQQQQQQAEPDDTFRFLVTTDNHLGYKDMDPRRGDDSFVTFEECLQHAHDTNCDAALLGGDLFDENKPSIPTLKRSIELFQSHCLGSKDIHFELLSNPADNFPAHHTKCANFQNPNLNIALPVFAIHGNHDEPCRDASPIDILAASGVVNYFGKLDTLSDHMEVRPLLLRKGRTHVALYGMGNIRNERLHQALRFGKVHFARPKQSSADGGGVKWFSILVIHQSRGMRTLASRSGIPESMLRGFGVDLVIWGDEHEQLMATQPIEGCQFDVVQPGSTIHTSLTSAERNPKKCGVLEIRDDPNGGPTYRILPHTLTSVRPVAHRTVDLHAEGIDKTLDAVETHLRKVVDQMLESTEKQLCGVPEDILLKHPNLKYPLMRVNVDFQDPTPGAVPFPQPNLNRFGERYRDVVVNPEDLYKAMKPKPAGAAGARGAGGRRLDASGAVLGPDGAVVLDAGGVAAANAYSRALPVDDIRSKIAAFLAANAKDSCQLFSETEISQAVYAFVEKGEKRAIDEKLSELLNNCQREVWKALRKKEDSNDISLDELQRLAKLHKGEINKRFADAEAELMANDDDDGDGNDGNNAGGGAGGGRVNNPDAVAIDENVRPRDISSYIDETHRRAVAKNTINRGGGAAGGALAEGRRRDREGGTNGEEGGDDDGPAEANFAAGGGRAPPATQQGGKKRAPRGASAAAKKAPAPAPQLQFVPAAAAPVATAQRFAAISDKWGK